MPAALTGRDRVGFTVVPFFGGAMEPPPRGIPVLQLTIRSPGRPSMRQAFLHVVGDLILVQIKVEMS